MGDFPTIKKHVGREVDVLYSDGLIICNDGTQKKIDDHLKRQVFRKV